MGARDGDVLPLVAPCIVSGLVFVFILSLNEYVIAYMVAGFTVETLPIKAFNNLRMGASLNAMDYLQAGARRR